MAFFRKTLELIAIIAIGTFCNVHAVKVAISHCNDVGGQMESYKFDARGSPVECVSEQQNCTGGFSSVVHWLHKNVSDFEKIPFQNHLRLTSGNLIGGESGWISSMTEGWRSYGDIVKKFIQPSALALGMKDFGAGLRQTNTYMKEIGNEKFALANTCEVSYGSGPEWEFCNKTAPFITIQALNETTGLLYSIGVIGFVTKTVERLSLPGKLEFVDIPAKIKKTIDASENIKTFIAMGDGNRTVARQIIDQSSKVKLVIFGAGFSTTDASTYIEEYKGGYIVTAGRWGSSVGKLILDINENTGNIDSVPTKILQPTVHPGVVDGITEEAIQEVNKWRGVVTQLKGTKIGHSRVDLEGGELCWRQECNLGNLMTDAVVHCALLKYEHQPFPYPLHSVWHGGAFFEDTVVGGASISAFDVHKWLPYHNNVHIVKVQGQHLRNIFQASATGIDPSKAGAKDWRQFLQVSNGVEVYYETTSGIPAVSKIRLTHDEKGVPKLMDMNNEVYYYFAIPTYLYEGRGVYDFAAKYWEPVQTVNVSSSVGFDDDCLMGYIKALWQVSTGLEERIWIDGGTGGRPDPPKPDPNQPCESKGSNTAVTVVLTIVFFSIFLAIIYVGYFYVIPRLRNSGGVDYPPNQL